MAKSAKNNTTKLSSSVKPTTYDTIKEAAKDLDTKVDEFKKTIEEWDNLQTLESVKDILSSSIISEEDKKISLTSSTNAINCSTSGCVSAASGTVATSTSGSLYATSTTPSWATISTNTIWTDDTFYRHKGNMWLTYLKEDELRDIFDKLLARQSDESIVRRFVSDILDDIHLSEDFLIDLYKFTTKEKIMQLHASDINSGNYPSLKLLMEV